MFPPTPQDWLPEDDLVYFILDTVATIDLTPVFAYYERGPLGAEFNRARTVASLTG